MIECRNLEIHASHACNLACESCSHLSNHGHSGNLSIEDATAWFGDWSKRLKPKQFSILGGEPTLNPYLTDIVWLSHEHWVDAKVVLVTNGFYLSKHPHLPVALSLCNVDLVVSVHHNGEEYQQRLHPVRELVSDWERRWSIKTEWRDSLNRWRRTWRKDGRPFNDGNPQQSWASCKSKWCLQLHEGKLWKCPQIAYLPMQTEKCEEWGPYLQYEPLMSDCTDEQLERFVNKGCEAVCSMCPASPELFSLPSPLRS